MAESSGRSGETLTVSTLQTLVYELASVDDWYSLGLNLGLGMHKLRTIECNYQDSNRRKTEMLYLWLRSASHPTWEAVIDALCVMGNFSVALNIKREYISSTTTDAASQPSQRTTCSPGRPTRVAVEPCKEQNTLGEENLIEITDYLLELDKTDIYNLGLVLGLSQRRVKAMMNSETFLDDMISAWLQRIDLVEKRGVPTWHGLVEALRHRRVGETSIASEIEKDKL